MKLKKESCELILLLAWALALIAFSAEAKAGAQYGFALAEQIVVPSLLPLLMLFNMISKSGAAAVLEKLFGAGFERVFRLPRCTVGAVLFGLTGGYPTGALLTGALVDAGEIDEKTARRILRFNVNGGAAFIITGVGTAMLGNQNAGILLFVSTTASAVLMAAFSAAGQEKIKNTPRRFDVLPFGDALVEATESAVRSVLCISAYIILFSALKGISEIPDTFEILLEITSGIDDCRGALTLAELAGFIAFAGICIHFQLLPVIKKVKMKYADFLVFRVIHAFLSFGICKALQAVFPSEAYVFSNTAAGVAGASSLNTALSVLMVLSFAVLIFDIENKKSRC